MYLNSVCGVCIVCVRMKCNANNFEPHPKQGVELNVTLAPQLSDHPLSLSLFSLHGNLVPAPNRLTVSISVCSVSLLGLTRPAGFGQAQCLAH